MKDHPSIGCCGIDCGLCPRFHSTGTSACPGCGGLNFREKHPSCGYLTCCAVRRSLEVCSECSDYPCSRFEPERNGYDSFVTHRKVFDNLEFIKSSGITLFLEQQKARMALLEDLLTRFDDGRSKSFFCLCCALLPLETLRASIDRFTSLSDKPTKERNRQVRQVLLDNAVTAGIDLKLRSKHG